MSAVYGFVELGGREYFRIDVCDMNCAGIWVGKFPDNELELGR